MRTTNPIAALFGKSPIRPLQEHMGVVEECVAEMVPLFEALRAGDRERIVEIKDRVFALETRADELKNDIRSHLPKSLFLPVDRRDLLSLLKTQDSIADTAQDVAGLLCVRDMRIPEPLKNLVPPYVQRNLDATKQCRKVINELDELLAASFRGPSADAVLAMVDELNHIETDADRQAMELLRALFEAEDTLKPLAVVFWYRLIRMIGDIADHAENVGDRLRLLLAH